jgi:hypothetical protein
MIEIGAASRCFPGEVVSGDAWRLDHVGAIIRIAMIDALGHGPAAAEVARVAIETLAAAPMLAPIESLLACHRALRGTRGAAVAVARLDLAAGQINSAGIGNVDVQLWQNGRGHLIASDRGIVGAIHAAIHQFEQDLASPWCLILHTDGVSSRFSLDDISAKVGDQVQDLADAILLDHARELDDATVVVCRPRPNSSFGD